MRISAVLRGDEPPGIQIGKSGRDWASRHLKELRVNSISSPSVIGIAVLGHHEFLNWPGLYASRPSAPSRQPHRWVGSPRPNLAVDPLSPAHR